MGRKASGFAVMAVMAAILSLVFTGQAFAGPTDNVLSENIKEADGTSGQDTNSGSGVKTGHIQDGAIATPKIVNGAVTDAKITGPISGSKLGSHTHNGADIVNGTVSTSKMADGAVTTPKIVNGAVTDAKITGPISGSKLGTHTHSGSDVTSGTIGVDKLATYSGVRVVHKGPVDGVNTFNTINAALNSITNSSSTDRYAVMVKPGIYNSSSVTMKDYVDVIGSGQGNTVLEYNVATSPVVTWPSSVNNAVLENLMVRGTGGGGAGRQETIRIEGSATMRDVTVIASNYSQSGIYFYNGWGYFEMYDSTVIVEAGTRGGSAIEVNGDWTLIKDCIIDITWEPGSMALGVFGNYVTIDDSIITLAAPDGGYGVLGDDNTISNSTITVTATTDNYGTEGVEGTGGNLKINNSTVVASTASPNNGTFGVNVHGGTAEVNNSVVSGSNLGIRKNTNYSFKIGSSQIIGGHNGSSGTDKVVNCHDGSYNPIPNL